VSYADFLCSIMGVFVAKPPGMDKTFKGIGVTKGVYSFLFLIVL
jgi:hypothetical protein